MERKQKITIYKNGFVIRRKNKRLTVIERDGGVNIIAETVDGETEPSCSHKVIKGKIRETKIAFSEEAMNYLSYCWLKHQENKKLK